MKILASEKLSAHRFKTTEGYLICIDAIIARTGVQEYLECELDPSTNSQEVVKCFRPEEEVFSPETIASFENKPLTMHHPQEDVDPENYERLAIGFVRDVHRDGNNLVANIVINKKDAIDTVESGEMDELSCGYDCEVKKEGDKYVQRNIRGNHVALVEAGRAGNARIIDSAIKDGFMSKARMVPYERKQLEAAGTKVNDIYDRLVGLGDKVFKEKFFKRFVEEAKQRGSSFKDIMTALDFGYAANIQYEWVREVFHMNDSAIQDSKYVIFEGQTCKLLNPQAKPYGKVRPKIELPDGRKVETYWDLIKIKDSINDAIDIDEAIEYYQENAFGYNGLRDYVETDCGHLPKEERERIYKEMKRRLGDSSLLDTLVKAWRRQNE